MADSDSRFQIRNSQFANFISIQISIVNHKLPIPKTPSDILHAKIEKNSLVSHLKHNGILLHWLFSLEVSIWSDWTQNSDLAQKICDFLWFRNIIFVSKFVQIYPIMSSGYSGIFGRSRFWVDVDWELWFLLTYLSGVAKNNHISEMIYWKLVGDIT